MGVQAALAAATVVVAVAVVAVSAAALPWGAHRSLATTMEAPAAPTEEMLEGEGPSTTAPEPPAAQAAAAPVIPVAPAAVICEAFLRLPAEETALLNGEIAGALRKW